MLGFRTPVPLGPELSRAPATAPGAGSNSAAPGGQAGRAAVPVSSSILCPRTFIAAAAAAGSAAGKRRAARASRAERSSSPQPSARRPLHGGLKKSTNCATAHPQGARRHLVGVNSGRQRQSGVGAGAAAGGGPAPAARTKRPPPPGVAVGEVLAAAGPRPPGSPAGPSSRERAPPSREREGAAGQRCGARGEGRRHSPVPRADGRAGGSLASAPPPPRRAGARCPRGPPPCPPRPPRPPLRGPGRGRGLGRGLEAGTGDRGPGRRGCGAWALRLPCARGLVRSPVPRPELRVGGQETAGAATRKRSGDRGRSGRLPRPLLTSSGALSERRALGLGGVRRGPSRPSSCSVASRRRVLAGGGGAASDSVFL